VSRPRVHALVVAALLVTAGCVDGPLGGAGTPTDGTRTTSAPLPGTEATVGDGPKERPDRPPTLNESSTVDYVRTFEYRLSYNALHYGPGSDVSLDCTVETLVERPYGYTALVTCTGYSNTQGTATNETATVVHADWGSRTFRYRVSPNATTRTRAER
jgi:hypothetical protein